MWSTGERNGKPLQYSCLENPMNSMKRQKDRTLKDERPRLVGAQYATGDQWRNNSRKNEEMEPKQKQNPVVDVTGGRSKIQCCKEQYCLGTWNVRSMNQGKLEVVKQEMARVNINILGIREKEMQKGRMVEEALQIAEKRREAKGKGEKERDIHLNEEFQRIARRDKIVFLNDQCKEIEKNNRMGKTRDLFKKIRDTK